MSDNKPTTTREVVRTAREAAESRVAASGATVTPAVPVTTAAPNAEAGKAGEREIALKATAIDIEHGVIIGIGALADAIDLDNEYVPAEMMVKCAHDFCASTSRAFKSNHSVAEKATLVESWTAVPVLDKAVEGVTHTDANGLHRLKAGQHIPADRTVVATAFKASSDDALAWFTGIKPADPAVVELAKNGGISGLSWSGPITRG